MTDLDFPQALAGDTMIWTSEGFRALSELDHAVTHQVYVLRRGGAALKPVTIESVGLQPTVRVTVTRNGIDNTLTATPSTIFKVLTHQDPTRRVTRVTAASDLAAGDRLLRVKPHPIVSSTALSHYGIAAGVVFGDGTIETGRGESKVALYGDKQELAQYFNGAPQWVQQGGDLPLMVVRGLPLSFKRLPDPAESSTYQYGWLAGYFATDGTVSADGYANISSVDRDALTYAQHAAARLGIDVGEVRQYVSATNVSKHPTIYYKLYLHGGSVPPEFFLREKHRSRLKAYYRPPHAWSVKSVAIGTPTPTYQIRTASGEVAAIVTEGFISLGGPGEQ